MTNRSRSRWLAGGGALLLVLSFSGIVAAHNLVTDSSAPAPAVVEPVTSVDATQTFEDVDGNGIDDQCQDATVPLVPNLGAAAAALAAADLDGNGKISTSEAAQSGWTGGPNCNHGGYVSGVANDEGDADQVDEKPPVECPVVVPVVAPVAPVDPVAGTVTPDTAPSTHGKAVSAVAQSDAVGGKNCNHGGAVREAARQHGTSDKAAAKHAASNKATAKRHGKGHGQGRGE